MDQLLFRPKNLKRVRIEKVLEKADGMPFVLLVAPMGYGKTTVVQEFLDQKKQLTGCINIWLSMGKNEVDSIWLWNRLRDKLKLYNTSLAHAVSQLSFPGSQYEIGTLLELIHGGFEHPVNLVLDDWHECACDDVNQLLQCIIYEKIPNLRLIMLSRTYPKLPYEEMWMKGYCIVIGQSFLALNASEISEFFTINGIFVNDEELENICYRTEGWMSALYLVYLDYKKSGKFQNTGSINHLIRDFIYQEISQEGKQVLQQLALFDSFTLDQAVFITEKKSCRFLLPQLAEDIAFIKYDLDTGEFRFHSIFRSVLLMEFDQVEIDKKRLYLRCAGWYEKEEAYIYAIRYYQEAGEPKEIFRIIEQQHCNMLYEQAPSVIHDFFHWVGEERALAHPVAYLPYIRQRLINDENIVEGRLMLERAKTYYDTHTCLELERNQLLGELCMVEWNLEFNDLGKMVGCAKTAYDLMNGCKSLIFQQDSILTYGAAEMLFLYHSKVGKLRETVELEKQYTLYYMRLINGYEGGWDSLFDAEYCMIRGRVGEAEELAEFVLQKAKIRGQACVIISAYFLLLRGCVHRGDGKRFEKLWLELRERMYGEQRITILMDYDVALGYLYGCIGRADEIAPWLRELDLKGCNRIMRSVRSGCVVYGHYLISKGDWVRLENLAEEMNIPFSVSRHIMAEIYAGIYYAVAKYHLYGLEEGKNYLDRAAAKAAPDGVIMPFVEYIDCLTPILLAMPKENTFLAEICRLGEIQKKGVTRFSRSNAKDNSHIITKRELEMMKLVAQGYKNTEISKAMHIALVTVEKKLTCVYRKLGVPNRVAAVERLRELEEL